jgi:signal transduction histidine kinase
MTEGRIPSQCAENHTSTPESGISDPSHPTESSLWLPIHLLKKLCERVPVGIALYDREMSLQHCNPAWVEMIDRYTPTSTEAVKPGTYLINLIPETETLIHAAFTRALQGETITVDGLRLQAGDRLAYWDMTFSPLSENQAVEEVMVIAIESTERVLTHQELDHHVLIRTRELTALHDVMAAANRFSDPERVIAHSLARVLDVIACEVGAIHLLDSQRQTLRLAAAQGIDLDVRGKISAVDVEQGLAGLTVDRGVPLVLPSIAEGSKPLLALPANSSQPYVGVPLRAKDQALGVLSVIGSRGREFTNEEITLLVAIADGIGTALENARLRHHAEQLAVMRERERLARELHDSVTQSLYSLTLLAEAGHRRELPDQNLSVLRQE